MEQNSNLVSRNPDFESISKGLRAWINVARDGRTYLVLVGNDGSKTYLNITKKVEAQASLSQVTA